MNVRIEKRYVKPNSKDIIKRFNRSNLRLALLSNVNMHMFDNMIYN